jgi:hypothetical protein
MIETLDYKPITRVLRKSLIIYNIVDHFRSDLTIEPGVSKPAQAIGIF